MKLPRIRQAVAHYLRIELTPRFSLPFLVSLSLLISAATIWDFHSSNLLANDDNIFLGRYLFGEKVPALSHFAFFNLLETFALFESIWVFKSLLVIQKIIIGSVFAIILYRFSNDYICSLLLAIAIVSFPVSVDQNFFVTGSHPTTAAAVFSIYLLLFVNQLGVDLRERPTRQVCSLFLQVLLVLLCSKLSPSFILAPIVALASTWFLVYRQAKRVGFSAYLASLVLIGVLPVAISLVLDAGYHYESLEGWVSISLAQVFVNLGNAVKLIVVSPFVGLPYLEVFYLLPFGLFLFLKFGSPIQFRLLPVAAKPVEIFAFVAICVLSAALFFGPSSIVTQYTGRYAVAPFYMAALGLSVFITSYSRGALTNWRMAPVLLYGALSVVALTSLVHGALATNWRLEPYLQGHQNVVNALSKRDWTDNDQIYISLPRGQKATTFGLNHWSTWYLRIVTRNPNVIGVVGEMDFSQPIGNAELFVESYRDHGPEYWHIVDGRSQRKQMIGLERGRPLFVFKPNKNGKLKLAPAAIWDQKSLRVIEAGQIPSGNDGEALPFTCEKAPVKKNLARLAHKPVMPQVSELRTVKSNNLETDGKKISPLNVEPISNLFTVLRVRLESTNPIDAGGIATFSSSTPPMPLRSRAIVVYELPDMFRVVDHFSKRSWQVKRNIEQELEIVMAGCQSQVAFLWLDGRPAGIVERPRFEGTWQVGGGFKNRFWRGALKEFSIQVYGEDP